MGRVDARKVLPVRAIAFLSDYVLVALDSPSIATQAYSTLVCYSCVIDGRHNVMGRVDARKVLPVRAIAFLSDYGIAQFL
ncbi:hypothetical protein J6590_036431 [Homalodisca vitripennis]|nr:hypothetical protein J6590_036431 [Homalodisca vitripennis]